MLTRAWSPARVRNGSVLAVLIGAVLTVSGCITQPVTTTANSDGSVTIAWSGSADAYDSGLNTGSRLLLCSPGVVSCGLTNPDLLFFYDPAGDSTETTLRVGATVQTPDSNTVGLPAGTYEMQVWNFLPVATSPMLAPLTITVARVGQRPTWFQSYGRESADAECPYRWSPGWAQWPNDGTGGYVCTRLMYADVDDEQVPDGPRAAGGAPWLQSLPRASMDAECPDGWDPSWEQWPNDGAGGPVCTRQG